MKPIKEMLIQGIILSGLLLFSLTGFATEQLLTPVTSTVDMIKNTILYIAIPLCIIAVAGCGIATAMGELDKKWVFNALIGTAWVAGAGTIVMIIKVLVGG